MPNDNVNHPKHYEKAGHKECIDLLETITRGYSGIAAGDLMQAKYLYRAGSKDEAGMSQTEKALEDFKKFNWYLNHFKQSAMKTECGSYDLPAGWACFSYKTDQDIEDVVTEFTWDKQDSIKQNIAKLLRVIVKMTTFNEVDYALSIMSGIISTVSSSLN